MRAALALVSLVDHIARPAEASGPALEFGTRGRSRPPGALPASCSAVVQEAIAGRAALYLPLAISSALFSRPPPPDSSRAAAAAAARSLLCLRANRLAVISPDSGRWNRPLGTDSAATALIRSSIIGDNDLSSSNVSRKPYTTYRGSRHHLTSVCSSLSP